VLIKVHMLVIPMGSHGLHLLLRYTLFVCCVKTAQFNKIAQQVTTKTPLQRSLNANVAQSKHRPFAVNTVIELKNVTTSSDSNGIWWGVF